MLDFTNSPQNALARDHDSSVLFFRELRPFMGQIVAGCPNGTAEAAELILISKILFLQFLQGTASFKEQFFSLQSLAHQSQAQHKKCYQQFIRPLFEQVFAVPQGQRQHLAEEIVPLAGLPYLDAELFSSSFCSDASVNDEPLCRLLCEIIPRYRWTIAAGEPSREESARFVSPWIIGYIYERWIDQRATGSYFTPDALAYHLACHALEEWFDVQSQGQPALSNALTDALKCWHCGDVSAALKHREVFAWLARVLPELKIIDPSLGGGAFLVAAARVLYGLALFCWSVIGNPAAALDRALLLRHIFAENIYGIDIKPEASIVAKMRLWLLALELEPTVLALQGHLLPLKNFVTANSLLTFSERTTVPQPPLFDDSVVSFTRPSSVSPRTEQDQFDVCIGNPPFIALSQHNHVPGKTEFIQSWNQKHPDYPARTTSDLSNFFILGGIERLKSDGVLAYITSRNFFDTRYGDFVRRFLTREVELRHIFTLHNHPFVQEGIKVKANTVILSLVRRSPSVPLWFEHLMAWDQPFLHIAGKVVDRNELYASSNWTQALFEQNLGKELQGRCHRRLSEFARVRMGIKSGCNSFFLLRTDSESFKTFFSDVSPRTLVRVVKNSRAIVGFALPRDTPYRLLNLYDRLNGLERGYQAPDALVPVARYVFEHGVMYACPECQKLACKEQRVHPERYPHRGVCDQCSLCNTAAARCDRPVDRLSTQGHHPEWYTLALGKPPSIAVQCIVDTEIGVFFNPSNIYATDQFQVIDSSGERETDALVFLYLTSRIARLLLEGIGLHRARFDGSFMLKIQVEHLSDLPSPDLDALDHHQKNRLLKLLDRMMEMKDRKSDDAKNLVDQVDEVFLQALGYPPSDLSHIQVELRSTLEQAIRFRWEKTRMRNSETK